ncbi:MAG TPA: YegP family protein [Pyrinomonadaceae bacterium]
MNEPIFYQEEKTQKWRWRVKANNGRIIDASTQSFSSEQSAQPEG